MTESVSLDSSNANLSAIAWQCRGLLGTCATVAKEEGPKALWSGLEPGTTLIVPCLYNVQSFQDCRLNCSFAGLHRQVLFGGLRIGLYEPVKRLYMGKRPADQAPLHLKIAAGMTTGALAICIASPTDLVKVQTPPPEVHPLLYFAVSRLAWSSVAWRVHYTASQIFTKSAHGPKCLISPDSWKGCQLDQYLTVGLTCLQESRTVPSVRKIVG